MSESLAGRRRLHFGDRTRRHRRVHCLVEVHLDENIPRLIRHTDDRDGTVRRRGVAPGIRERDDARDLRRGEINRRRNREVPRVLLKRAGEQVLRRAIGSLRRLLDDVREPHDVRRRRIGAAEERALDEPGLRVHFRAQRAADRLGNDRREHDRLSIWRDRKTDRRELRGLGSKRGGVRSASCRGELCRVHVRADAHDLHGLG